MRRLLRALVILLVVMAVAAGVAVNAVLGRLDQPYKGYGETERLLDIPPRTTVAEIGRRLVEAGVVSDPYLFRIALWRSGTESLQAGEYLFAGEAPIAEVIDAAHPGVVVLSQMIHVQLSQFPVVGVDRRYLEALRNESFSKHA
jgi:cell division protein YceG involved in septum cleavage